jgi:2-oxo-4-hydroxy-4-carboxy-5-ureidoimidazoline decarboxylase
MRDRIPAGVVRLNRADDATAAGLLHEVCTSTAWVRAVLAERPFAGLDALCEASDAAMLALTSEDLGAAMAGHPPIGRTEKLSGYLRPGGHALASEREQRGMAGASDELKAEMFELNSAYQDKFGHVFLICATGLTGEQLRDAAKARIGNTPEQEREIVRTELGKINRIRLTRLAEGGQAMTAPPRHQPLQRQAVSTHILDTSVGRPAEGIAVELSVRCGADAPWAGHGASKTDADGRCKDLPPLPEGVTQVRLCFEVEPYFTRTRRQQAAFFPEVVITFAVEPGEHYHVPLLLNPFGYSVYRGS